MRANHGDVLSQALRSALGPPEPSPAAAALIGLEHEYQVRREGRQVDFRGLIHSLAVPGRRLDPGDLNAYRLDSGLALTCDEAEAEIASPPIAVAPGFAGALDGWALEGLDQVERIIPPGLALDGYSTHLSVSVPDAAAAAVMRLFCAGFGAALMLLLNTAESRGVYVRPRPGRLELCGDYVRGDYLRASAIFFAGAVRACAEAVAGRPRGFPRLLAPELPPATSRYGVYLGRRRAFGFDLHAQGRGGGLPLAAGGVISVQEHLEEAWAAAKRAIERDCAPADLELVDAIAGGGKPLRVEPGLIEDYPSICPRPLPSAFGSILDLPARGGVSVEATAATWDSTIFRIEAGGRPAWAAIPRASLPAFLDAWGKGALAETTRAYGEAGPSGRRLTERAQASEVGLWDEVQTSALLPRERGPDGEFVGLEADPKGRGGKAPARAGKAPARPGKARARPGKLVLPGRGGDAALPPLLPPGRPSPSAPPPPLPSAPPEPSPRPAPWPRPLVATVAAVVVAIVVTVAAVVAADPFGGAAPAESARDRNPGGYRHPHRHASDRDTLGHAAAADRGARGRGRDGYSAAALADAAAADRDKGARPHNRAQRHAPLRAGRGRLHADADLQPAPDRDVDRDANVDGRPNRNSDAVPVPGRRLHADADEDDVGAAVRPWLHALASPGAF